MCAKPKVILKNIQKTFRDPRRKTETVALRDINVNVVDGEFLCLLGPSGCGKSTILNLIAGFDEPSKGEILLDDRPVGKPSPDRGMIFQTAELFPWLSVAENIAFGLRMTGVSPTTYGPKVSRYLELMGLEGFDKHYPYELSGGMRQRVALARVWITNPTLFLMDEPFGALDAQTRLLMQELLVRIWIDARRTSLFVTHDVDESIFLGDRILLMSARPGMVRESIDIPFQRPRIYQDLIFDKDFNDIKNHVLNVLREESLHLINRHAKSA